MVPPFFIPCLGSITSFCPQGPWPSPSEVPGLLWEAHTGALLCSSAGGVTGHPAWPLSLLPPGPVGAMGPTRCPRVQPCQGPVIWEEGSFLREGRAGRHKPSPSAQGHPEHSHLVVRAGLLLLCHPLVQKAPGALEGQRPQCPLSNV